MNVRKTLKLRFQEIASWIETSQLWLCGVDVASGQVLCISPGLREQLGPSVGSALNEIIACDTPPGMLEPFSATLKHAPATPVLGILEPLDDGTALLVLQPCGPVVPNRQKEHDFVSTVSHEFRTPLTSIKGFADTMIRYGANLPADQQKRFLQIIKDQADRLIRLVENVLTATRTGKLHQELAYQPIDVVKMLDRVIQTVQGKQTEARDIRLTLPPGATLPKVWADQDKLEQVLLNLVDNAVKYSPNKKPVTVKAQMLAEPGDVIEIRIIDQGVGISAEHLPKLFSQFSRIDNPLTREVDGTGLGLYITKSLVLEMGGTIDVASIPGEGSTFRITFPVATPERQAQHQAKLHAEAPTPMADGIAGHHPASELIR
jgi:two-component system phosphate regulon sensor histidine kinase PhoR